MLLGKAFSFAFFSVVCPVCFQYPRPSGTLTHSMYNFPCASKHHVRSSEVSCFFNVHCLAKCLIAIPLQLVTMSCFGNTVSQLSVKDFLIA